ncbi:MAG: tetratricopeptide repeat protein [Bacteroidales bacterium]|nr:tetratricopeptide repeat protein [Bacteroidales bacterium]
MQRIKSLLVIAVMMMAVQPVFGQKSSSDEGVRQLYRQAVDLYQKEKYASAQHLFDKLTADAAGVDEEMAREACFYGAVCAERLGNSDADFRLTEFLRRYPQNKHTNMANFYLGNYHYAAGDYAKALKYYKKVPAREVEYGHRSEYNFKVGYCYFVDEDYAEAKKYFSQDINGRTKYTNASLYYYAHLQYMEGKYDLALRNFEKLQSDNKFAKIVPSYVARIYYYLGKNDELLQMAPTLLLEEDVFKKNEIRQMVAEVYFNRGEYKNALDYYTAAMRNRDREETAAVQDVAPATGKGRKSQTPVACTPQDSYYQIGYCHYMLHQYDSAQFYLGKKTACDDSVAQSALYVLGDVDIKLGRKNEARSMFLQASKMDYDPKIKEDALFNYAKLSYELNANPYNESIRSFEDYLAKYPKSVHKAEVQEILSSLYFTTRNYKDALTLIEKIPDRTPLMNQAYQRIVINRGIEVFNTGNMKTAASYFQKAAKINALPKYTTDAYYLYAESRYRMGDYDAAGKTLDRFMVSSNATTSPYYRQALYTHGYLCMKRNNIADAADDFKIFLRLADKSIDKHQVNDVNNRLGDCSYLDSKYADAIKYYDRVIEAEDADADYATYQKALCYGAMGKYHDKLTYLNQIFERYNQSPLAPKALFEIGNTYLVCDNNEMALLYFNNFRTRYPQNSLVKTALLNMGLIYYNTDRNNEALDVFDQLLTHYAGTDEARDALSTVKNIYVSQNRVDEYFTYVKRTTKTNVSTVEQDSTLYMSAENLYMNGDCESSVKSFESYLSKFPEGLFHLQAHYYAADCLFRNGQNEQALPHYEAVAAASRNSYTERSLHNAANIAYNLNNFTKALDLYGQLVEVAENANNRLAGRVGYLRSWVHLAQRDSIVSAARMLLAEPKITDELRDEARISMARSYYETSATYPQADSIYALLTTSTNGDYSGEASYRRAEMRFLQADYDASERVIETITAAPVSDYWLAKSFILWADIFHARGNNLQAKQTLQSIIDNYDGDDLVQVALQKRNAILEEEKPVQQPEEEEIVIELEKEPENN